ncbi:hypothetical protein [Nonlabens sp.]|uniref:hypothetical protein n=1 Tax=Nonlabens sp. TaxID=1888209 RepID=UPI003F6A0E12
MEQIIKKSVLVLSCIAFIACNDSKKSTEKPVVNVSITSGVSHDILNKKVSCGDKNYSFSIPNFTSQTDADKVLNYDITKLITQDFIDLTYQKDASLNSIYETFLNRRERVLCEESKNEGLLDVKTIFVSDTEKFIGYELEFTRNDHKGRVLKTFLKPDMKEIKLADLIPEGKEYDVLTIFNANLQQAVANLITDIPTGELRDKFIVYLNNTAFQFDPEDFKTCDLSFQVNSKISKNLRLAKKVDLPKGFEFLNNTVVIEIDAYQLTHYLKLSNIIE